MRFYLVDRIQEIVPGKKIVAVKSLALGEEYLADHFPAYPVLPGVMMLEALVQAAAWLVRLETDYGRTLVLLKEARNVRYGNFLRPGGQMILECEAREIGPDESRFKALGRWDGTVGIQARLVLTHRNVVDEDPARTDIDDRLREHLRERFRLMGGPRALEASAAR